MAKFWGLTICVGKKFKQHVQESFCISGAALEPLDTSTGRYDDKPIQLYLQQDEMDYLICSLSTKHSILQVPLNVCIGSGETVGFYLKGGSPKSHLHLTGYTFPRGDAVVTPPAGIPFKGQQKSILVTERKSNDAQKKRVSIVETEPFGEREESESGDDDDDDDDDDPVEDIRRNLFNGGNADSDEIDEDEDDDESSDMDEDELKEFQQLLKKGQYDPKTGGKMQDEDSDSDDVELIGVDDEDDDDDDSDGSVEEFTDNKKTAVSPPQGKEKAGKQKSPTGEKLKEKGTPNSSPEKQKIKGTPNKDKKHDVNANATPKTPENQNLKLKAPSSAGHTPMKTFTKGGVLVNDVKIGTGQAAKPGKMASVYYVGRLKSNNKQFDSSQSGGGFKFRLGKGEVIKGWDLGVEGMKVGGKRRLTIPAQLAYGKRGAPPDIPPNSTLLFDIELKNVS